MQLPRIDRYLATDEALGPIVAKARQIDALAKLCTEFLPPALARQVRAANFKDGELVLLAGNPSAAAKLKLVAESLRKFLLRQGSKVSLVSVRVQPNSAQAAARSPGKSAVLTIKGIAELSGLYDRLTAESPARQALGRLLRRHRAKPGRKERL